MAKTFQSFVRDILKTRVPHRLLCVFLETKDATKSAPLVFKAPARGNEKASWIRVCSHAHMAVTEDLTFDLLVENADTHGPGWTTVVVAACHNTDRTMPSVEDANLYLSNMRQRILEGDRSSLTEFDRQGNSVSAKESARA